MTPLKRPILRYHGGKWKLSPWVISHFPEHRIYVEPFGGSGSVLIRKKRSYGEVYNDLESEVVNVFRMLRNQDTAMELMRRLELTPFAREEFQKSYEPAIDDIDRACKMIIRAYMGFGSASMTRTHKTGFRSNSNRSGTTPAQDWRNWPSHVPLFVDRLRGVVVENKDAAEIMLQHDGIDTLHYIDPPYPWSTRQGMGEGRKNHAYKHEMNDIDHEALAYLCHQLKGMVVISGYPCELYDKRLYPKWHRFECKHFADGARERVEVIWMNEAAHAGIKNRQERML